MKEKKGIPVDYNGRPFEMLSVEPFDWDQNLRGFQLVGADYSLAVLMRAYWPHSATLERIDVWTPEDRKRALIEHFNVSVPDLFGPLQLFGQPECASLVFSKLKPKDCMLFEVATDREALQEALAKRRAALELAGGPTEQMKSIDYCGTARIVYDGNKRTAHKVSLALVHENSGQAIEWRFMLKDSTLLVRTAAREALSWLRDNDVVYRPGDKDKGQAEYPVEIRRNNPVVDAECPHDEQWHKATATFEPCEGKPERHAPVVCRFREHTREEAAHVPERDPANAPGKRDREAEPHTNADATKVWYTVKEAAAYVRCSERTIRNWLKQKSDTGQPMLPGEQKVGRKIRIPKADLDKWRKPANSTPKPEGTPGKRARRKRVKRES